MNGWLLIIGMSFVPLVIGQIAKAMGTLVSGQIALAMGKGSYK